MFDEVYIKTNKKGFKTEVFEKLFYNVNMIMSKDCGMCAIHNKDGKLLVSCMFGNIEELVVKNY